MSRAHFYKRGLQTGKATRDVYVRPPRECSQREFYWLLHVTTYGLVNANAKWQWHSDCTLNELGLSAMVHVPQLFYLISDGALLLIDVKVVDDILLGGPEEVRKQFIKKLSTKYTLGTVVSYARKA